MTIKELKERLYQFDNDDKIVVDGRCLRVHEQKNNWYSHIRIENTLQLTHKEKIKYLQMAFGIVSEFKIDLRTLDMIVSLSDLIDTKKEQTCLKSICEVKKEVEKRAANNSLPEGYQLNK